MSVFEYGSGWSTCFFAEKVMSVTSVEYDKYWFDLIASNVPSNVKLCYQEKDIDGEYCRIISTTNKQYDVVFIDGRDRANCLKHSILSLSPRGVLILDDSQRERYKAGIDFVKEQGFRALDIEGLKAMGRHVDRCTILYRNDNCFDI